MPVIVAVVLKGLPRALRLRSVVAAAGEAFVRCGRGENGGALLKEESDVAFEMDGVAQVDAGGEGDGSAACVGCGIDGCINSR